MKMPPRSRGEIEIQAERSFVVRRLVLPIQEYLHTEGLSGYLLVAAGVMALIWANSPWAASYEHIRHAHIAIDVAGLRLDMTVHHWVNEALMTLFFFVAGLEIKRELVSGELSDMRRSALPIMAAIGGMLVPAAIYVAFNFGTPAVRGWGVPMATDIAFAVGVLALLGDRIPVSVRILLLALAIVDDIGAILVIAAFYAQGLSGLAFGAAAALVILVVILSQVGIRATGVYVVVGAFLWLALYRSGIHPTLSGVILGLLAPTRTWFGRKAFADPARSLLDTYEETVALGNDQQSEAILGQLEALCRETESPLDRIERTVHPWANFVVLPLFALLNAGVPLSGPALGHALTSRVAIGVAVGLVVGKGIGVLGTSYLAVKLGLARLPRKVTWAQIAGISLLAGIGFTVSLFITDLAFTSEIDRNAAKIGILVASVVAGALGYAFLRSTTGQPSSVHSTSGHLS